MELRICRRRERTCFGKGKIDVIQDNFLISVQRNLNLLKCTDFTEECLHQLSKPQLIAMVLSQRDETKGTIKSLRDEVKEMNTNFKKLEADVGIVKTVINLLMKKSVDIEP